MKNHTKKPTSYFAKYRNDPEFQKHYREASNLLDIAIVIAEMRQKQKMTQKELAKRIGSNQSVISRIEKGIENITLGKLRKIAEALGAKVELRFT